MKKLFFLTAVFCLMGVSAFAQGKNATALGQGKAADFSGTWSLDVSKSTLDQRARVESMTMTVAQSTGSIKVDTETKRQAPPADAPQGGMGRGGGGMFGGDGSTTYMLDGKETTIQQETRMGSIPVKLTGKVDGSKLELTRVSTFNGPNGELTMTNKETWSLSDDGKTLTVQRDMTSPRGTNSSTLVFTKK
ncbi:MAG TPA: hypothetical protein VHL50_04570 [Pyrinomonadaceae bacterium]|nr:hypothetical protein [Pyrinomonadaceae bacterium]